MSKMKLLDSSGSEDDEDQTNPGFKINQDYAKRYEKWRGAECLQKLKDKHGAQAVEDMNLDEEESSSEEEDSDAEALTEEVEKEFYKTLASLKAKDPKIYDQKTSFFSGEVTEERKKKKKEESKMTLKDMQRKLILEKGGIEDEFENAPVQKTGPTYVEEVKKAKESLKAALEDFSDGEDESDENGEESGLFKKREISGQEKEKEEAEYKAWLAGQKTTLSDESLEKDMSGLRNFWNNQTLDRDEKFLQDYLLNKRYKEDDVEDVIPTYEDIVADVDSNDENLSEDEDELKKQEEFEHKYNFRFEQPDDQFIKRYPRTIKNSVRQKDDKRKKKRKEVEERKKAEKQQKMEEIKMLKMIKKKEIQEKLVKLKKITGNQEMSLNEADIDADFDPEEYDKRMKEIYQNFDDNEDDDVKPTFSDFEDDEQYGEELEVENWDGWTGVEGASRAPKKQGGADGGYQGGENGGEEYYGGEDDFNMDCDYDPAAQMQKQLIENTKGRKKSRRKSKFSQALEDSQNKPVFDPKDKTFEEYYDEYYKLDCEDIIGDMPVRFKYRNVEANDFGLTTDEIMLADDGDLNSWCSLKKTCQYRSVYEEKKDLELFNSKRHNMSLKKKVLPSVYEPPEEGEERDEDARTKKLKKKRKKGKKRNLEDESTNTQDDPIESKKAKIDASEEKTESINSAVPQISDQGKKSKKSKKSKQEKQETTKTEEPVNNSSKSTKEEKKPVSSENSKIKSAKNGQIEPAMSSPNKPAKSDQTVTSDEAKKKKKEKQKKRKEYWEKNKEKIEKKLPFAVTDQRIAAYGVSQDKLKEMKKFAQKNKYPRK